MELSDEQWAVVKPHLPDSERMRVSKKGGRPWRDPRDVLNGVLWVLRTGAPWLDMPARYPPYQTCHRRFQAWVKGKVFPKILRALAEDLRERGKVDLTEAFIDGSHAGAKRGVLRLELLDAAKQPNSWRWRTATVFQSPSGRQVVSGMKRETSMKR